jgi:hypothetical protein
VFFTVRCTAAYSMNARTITTGCKPLTCPQIPVACSYPLPHPCVQRGRPARDTVADARRAEAGHPHPCPQLSAPLPLFYSTRLERMRFWSFLCFFQLICSLTRGFSSMPCIITRRLPALSPTAPFLLSASSQRCTTWLFQNLTADRRRSCCWRLGAGAVVECFKTLNWF